jgi:hypothetical protein
MVILVAFTVGLIWWVCAWAFGIKAFDAFLLTAFITLVAATAVMIKPFMNQLLRREAAPLEERGAAR